MKQVRFGERIIGEGHPAFVIAEAGVNHNGDLELGRAQHGLHQAEHVVLERMK